METEDLLKGSLLMLWERPLIFSPKLFSTAVSSAVIVFALSNFQSIRNLSITSLFTVLVFAPLFLTFIGVAASVMVASMVKRPDSDNLLKDSLGEIRIRMWQILKASLVFVGISIFFGIALSLAYTVYLLTGNLAGLILIGLICLIGVMAVTYASYFLPATILEFSSLKDSFSRSFMKSRENNRLVTFLIILSIFLLAIGFFSTGRLEKIGYAGFVTGRLISALINTYVFVLSPKLYYSTSKSPD